MFDFLATFNRYHDCNRRHVKTVVQGRSLRDGTQAERWRMTDHGYQNFFFSNHQKRQAKYSFYNLLLKERAFEESKIVRVHIPYCKSHT